jgi:hypothetical protein
MVRRRIIHGSLVSLQELLFQKEPAGGRETGDRSQSAVHTTAFFID